MRLEESDHVAYSEPNIEEDVRVDNADNRNRHLKFPVNEKCNDVRDETIRKETEKQPTEDNCQTNHFILHHLIRKIGLSAWKKRKRKFFFIFCLDLDGFLDAVLLSVR